MKKPKRDSTMVSFRADSALAKRLARAQRRAERKLADVVRRLVVRALDLEEAEAQR